MSSNRDFWKPIFKTKLKCSFSYLIEQLPLNNGCSNLHYRLLPNVSRENEAWWDTPRVYQTADDSGSDSAAVSEHVNVFANMSIQLLAISIVTPLLDYMRWVFQSMTLRGLKTYSCFVYYI